MATFKIDDVEYDTDNLSPVQTRVVGLYQKALKDEGDALNNLEVASCKIEIGRKLKELVIDTDLKKQIKPINKAITTRRKAVCREVVKQTVWPRYLG